MRRQEDEALHHMAMRAALSISLFPAQKPRPFHPRTGLSLHHGQAVHGDAVSVELHERLRLKGGERGGREFRPAFDLRVGERPGSLRLPKPAPQVGHGFRELGKLRKLTGNLARGLLDLQKVLAQARPRAFGDAL